MTDGADAAGIAGTADRIAGTADRTDGPAGSPPPGGQPDPAAPSAGGRGDPIVPEQRPLAVIDVDGVVADVRHRLRFLRAWPGDWDAFFAAASADPPLAEGVTLVHQLARDHEVVWLTGRPERSRTATSRWLGEQGLPLGELRMRPDDDRRPARLFKRAELRQLGACRQVAVVVDDDPAVVDLLRADGWPVLRAEWLAYEATLGNAQESEGRT
ncbi:hypothetical protein [Candidatus Frankia alpina]|uniref:phosphatase domain-containing protein n=1 Tax=Candidatus Frankia alpina TaxID=2699483 RepID=UPI003AF8B4A7